MRCLKFFFAATAGLSAISSFAQSPSTRIGWAAYYDVFPYRPVADTAVLRAAGVRAVKVHLVESDSIHPDLRDTLSKNCEVQLFNRSGQPVLIFRNTTIGSAVEKVIVGWNAFGYTDNEMYSRSKTGTWTHNGKTTWQYDSTGNRRYSRSETITGKTSQVTGEVFYTYDASGKKTGMAWRRPEQSGGRSYLFIDSTTYTYPDPNTIVATSRNFAVFTSPDTIIGTDTSVHIERYRDGLLVAEEWTRPGKDTSRTTYEYDKQGRLITKKPYKMAFAVFGNEDVTISYHLQYNERSLPTQLAMIYDHQRFYFVYFSYVYY